MGGLLLLLFIGLILAILVKIVIKVPWWAKPVVVIGAFLIVTTDGYLGRQKLYKLCEEQGGLHIYKTVENVEGYEIDLSISPSWSQSYNGYSFIEGESDVVGKVNRKTLNSDGTTTYEESVMPKSLYLVKSLGDYTFDEDPKNYDLLKNQIIDKQTGEVIAEAISFGYNGGWVDKFIAGAYASTPSITCSKPIHDQIEPHIWDETIKRVLKPKQQEQ